MIAFIFHMNSAVSNWGLNALLASARGGRIIASNNGPSSTYHKRPILKNVSRTLSPYHGAQYRCPLLHCLVHLSLGLLRGRAAESASIAIFHIIVTRTEFIPFQHSALTQKGVKLKLVATARVKTFDSRFRWYHFKVEKKFHNSSSFTSNKRYEAECARNSPQYLRYYRKMCAGASLYGQQEETFESK